MEPHIHVFIGDNETPFSKSWTYSEAYRDFDYLVECVIDETSLIYDKAIRIVDTIRDYVFDSYPRNPTL